MTKNCRTTRNTRAGSRVMLSAQVSEKHGAEAEEQAVEIQSALSWRFNTCRIGHLHHNRRDENNAQNRQPDYPVKRSEKRPCSCRQRLFASDQHAQMKLKEAGGKLAIRRSMAGDRDASHAKIKALPFKIKAVRRIACAIYFFLPVKSTRRRHDAKVETIPPPWRRSAYR